jgi:hypothetical protein
MDYAGDLDSNPEQNIETLKETSKNLRAYGVELRLRSHNAVARSLKLRLTSKKILQKKNGSQKQGMSG